FTDTFAVTAVADTPANLWVGTPTGLLRWELGTGRYVLMTQKDGLASDRVSALAADAQGTLWVATPKGLTRGARGVWQNFSSPPVGEFLTGLQPGPDGKTVWAGGPEGLARLRGNRWERYLPETSVTAMALQANGVLWVGTNGRGLLRVARPG